MNEKQPFSEFEEIRLLEDLFPNIVPKYREVHDIMTSMLDFEKSQQIRVVDLGCGFGDLTRRIIDAFPLSVVFGIDNQSAILERTREKFQDSLDQVVFYQRDLNNSAWMNGLDYLHAVVSSFALDYLPEERHKAIVEEVHEKLEPGGRWVSCEFFRSEDNRINRIFHDLEISFIQRAMKEGQVNGEQLEQLGKSTILRQQHHICTVDDKVSWLKQAGYIYVDVPWRFLNLAVITGVRK